MYYEDYISEEDLKTDFHIALDELIDAEVEKRLEERIQDIDHLREKQKQYDKKISEAQQKVKEADNKRYEAEKAQRAAERERDFARGQCKQAISDVTQQKLDELFGHWLKQKSVYYLERETLWAWCPYCSHGKVKINLPNGDEAVTQCKVCGGSGYEQYDSYIRKSMETTYPTFIKEYPSQNIKPYFMSYGWNSGMHRVALENVMTYEEATAKAEELSAENKQRALARLEARKKKLDEENK